MHEVSSLPKSDLRELRKCVLDTRFFDNPLSTTEKPTRSRISSCLFTWKMDSSRFDLSPLPTSSFFSFTIHTKTLPLRTYLQTNLHQLYGHEQQQPNTDRVTQTERSNKYVSHRGVCILCHSQLGVWQIYSN